MSTESPRVRVLLRTELFSPPSLPHAPRRVFVVEGALVDRQGGLTVVADAFYDGVGKPIEGVENQTLFLPMAKIDHAVMLDG
ncbi:MAG: hypothetical protein H6742_20200 [Alphaproteobacteria bacterium]|nr:hypothetical protein [Alphaproteobacteria bacterium]